MNTHVLVAGAGPTGLTLSIELARRGIDHLLVEADEAPAIGSRGKGLQPRSLEVLEDLGVVDEILANGSVGLPLRLYQGNELVVELATATSSGPRPGVPYPDLVMLPEWRVEQILRDRLTRLGGQIFYGAALSAFTQDDGVTATLANGQTVRARYLVGSDGGHSTVRHLLGATMDGAHPVETTSPLATLQGPHISTLQIVASGRADAPRALIGREAPRLYRGRSGTLILIRPDGYIALRTDDAALVAHYLNRTLGTVAPVAA